MAKLIQLARTKDWNVKKAILCKDTFDKIPWDTLTEAKQAMRDFLQVSTLPPTA